MNLSDIIKNVNTYIGDSSTDRLSTLDRYSALTEGTAWLLEELGNEHMVDRMEVEYLPTVTWYKMDTLTPYLLTSGQLRFKEEAPDREDFTRVEAQDLASMYLNRNAYAIERFNGDSYLGIILNDGKSNDSKDVIGLNEGDGLTYTGTNASNIAAEEHAIAFDMTTTGPTATGIETTTSSLDISDYEDTGYLIFEIEIPDTEDVTSVSLRFGTNLLTDYYLGTVTQDLGGNTLVAGVNTIKMRIKDLTIVGTPDLTAVTQWRFLVNHDTAKPAVDGFKLSDLRVAKPVYLTFKYIFYRVGKTSTGADIIEFTADTDVPFFIDRYPQYRFAVAHKAAAVLLRSLTLDDKARGEDRLADQALDRYRKNFSGEREMHSSAFKVAGVSLRNKRIIRRR